MQKQLSCKKNGVPLKGLGEKVVKSKVVVKKWPQTFQVLKLNLL